MSADNWKYAGTACVNLFPHGTAFAWGRGAERDYAYQESAWKPAEPRCSYCGNPLSGCGCGAKSPRQERRK